MPRRMLRLRSPNSGPARRPGLVRTWAGMLAGAGSVEHGLIEVGNASEGCGAEMTGLPTPRLPDGLSILSAGSDGNRGG